MVSTQGVEESRTSLVRRARKIDRVLAETYPDARCELDFDNPFELLVATVLSAQTTDKRVNAVRPTLFAAYPDAAGDGRRRPRATWSGSSARSGSSGPRPSRCSSSARRWSSASTARCRRGSTTSSPCPGVGRKTANVVLGNAFGIPGITVDTHFGRLVAPVRLDRGDRPGQGRARGRRAVPEARLDDAQPPPDLARPPASATPASPRAAPARSRAGARRTARGRPTRSRPPTLVKTEGRA